MSEANARIIIDKLLRESDWVLSGDDGVVNVDTEMQNQAGFADYVLKDSSDFPLCIIEAKKEPVSPLVGKEQARGYAESLNCRFVVLSNGVSHYFWDIEHGSPTIVDIFPSQEQLELRKINFNPPRQEVEEIDVEFTKIQSVRELIEIYTQKIQDRISKVWGEGIKPEIQETGVST